RPSCYAVAGAVDPAVPLDADRTGDHDANRAGEANLGMTREAQAAQEIGARRKRQTVPVQIESPAVAARERDTSLVSARNAHVVVARLERRAQGGEINRRAGERL